MDIQPRSYFSKDGRTGPEDEKPMNSYKQKKNWEKKLGQCPHCGLWLNKIIALTNLIEETEKEAYERGRKDGRAIWSEKDVVG